MDKENKKTKVVVTGGAGFIGSHLADALVKKGYEVHVVDDLSGGKRENVHPNATLHVVDIRNYEQLKEIFLNTDTVFHLAAIPQVQYSIENPVETNEVNSQGTMNVLAAAKDAGVRRVVYSASSAAYGDREDAPFHEEMEASPMSPYALQKYTGELKCTLFSVLYPLETVSLRYFNVYGTRQDPHHPYAGVVGRFFLLHQEGKPLTITGDGTQTRDFIHVSDVVRANILAMKSSNVGKGEVINIGTGKEISVKEIAETMGGEIVHVPPRVEPKRSCADVTKAKELLGWKYEIGLKEGLSDLIREK